MKACVYLKEVKESRKTGTSCICFRVRDKEIDIKVVSGLQVVDKYWDGDALRYRRNSIVDKNEQKRIPDQIAAIIEQIETSFDRNKADGDWLRQIIEDVLHPNLAYERKHPNLLKRLSEYISRHEGTKQTKGQIKNLYRLTRENVKDGFVEYMPQKTKKCEAKTVWVPLHEKALRILSKYEGFDSDRLLPFKPIYVYNNGIRELLRHCGIDRMVTVLDTHGYKTVQKPLYEVASSHTARKTFVGNLYKQVKDPNLIASMSGHSEGSHTFARYRKIDDEMKKELVNLLD